MLQMEAAIKHAEQNTSGEIRIHIENSCTSDALGRAQKVFGKLKMNRTVLRNGVLFYLAVKSRKFAVYGDQGINAVVPENFWEEIKKEMEMEFAQKNFSEGLSAAILKAGEQLKKHFLPPLCSQYPQPVSLDDPQFHHSRI